MRTYFNANREFKEFLSLIIASLATITTIVTPQLSLASTLDQVSNANAPVVGYVLLDNATINTMNTSKKPAVDRIIFSFLNPGMDPGAVKADRVGTPQYMSDIGLNGIDYKSLSHLIAKLKSENIQVFFSVGGWLYSEAPGDAENDGTNFGIRPVTSTQISGLQQGQTLYASNFPYTSDMSSTYQTLNLPYISNVESIARNQKGSLSTDDFTKTWVKVAQDFGANGLDLDYEENWFSQAYTTAAPHYADWRWSSNGPVENTYSSVKYAMYLHSLEANAQKNNLLVSIAAPAIGAFDIHEVTQSDYAAGNWYWNNGQGSGTLKGVIYDIANYNKISGTHGQDPDFPGHQQDFAKIFELNGTNILASSNLNEIGVMTYDLDDGYQNHPYDNTSDSVNSNYCIGWNTQGHPVARDTKPADAGTVNVDCSVASQAQAIMKSYQTALADFSTNLHAGLEVAYPNYPINISANLVGGGDNTTSSRYRWNDPYLPFSIPVVTNPDNSLFNCNNMEAIVNSEAGVISEMPYCSATTGNYPPQFLNVTQFLFSMKNLGANVNGIIIWSLNNQEYQQVLLPDANASDKKTVFALDGINYTIGITQVLSKVATGEQIAQMGQKVFNKGNLR